MSTQQELQSPQPASQPKTDAETSPLEIADAAEELAEENAEQHDGSFERPIINDYGEPVSELVKIVIEDNGEPLVDIFRVCPELTWMPQLPDWDFPRSGLIRETVAYQVKKAQSLLPRGLKLQIVGAFRPFDIQEKMYHAARAKLKEKHPDWDEDLLTEYINVFSAPPIWDTPPPHTTGGAVDLSIIDADGERLDMTSPFEMGWDSAPTAIEGLSETARKNRELLISILSESGITNFAGEWWHWSWGEPGWALRTGRPIALYGAVPEDEIPDWEPPST